LAPGSSQAATFTVVKDIAGDYFAEVEGLGGMFSIIPPIPAYFSISNLTVVPERVKQGESAAASVIVTNTGEVSGSYSVALSIKDIAAGLQEVNLGPGESQRVTFNITEDTPGFYQLNIEGLTGRFVVEMEWNE